MWLPRTIKWHNSQLCYCTLFCTTSTPRKWPFSTIKCHIPIREVAQNNRDGWSSSCNARWVCQSVYCANRIMKLVTDIRMWVYCLTVSVTEMLAVIFNHQTSHSDQRSRPPMMAERAAAAQGESVCFVTCKSNYETCNWHNITYVSLLSLLSPCLLFQIARNLEDSCWNPPVLRSGRPLAFWRKVSGPELRDIVCISNVLLMLHSSRPLLPLLPAHTAM